MSKHNRPRLSLRGGQPAPVTAPIEQVQAVPNAPIQERPMEAPTQTQQPEVTEVSGPTAKQMAEMEALNAERLRKQAELHNAAPPPEVATIDVVAQGYDALHEAFRRHNEIAAQKKEYVPPPRTARQMTALEEELEAGRRAQQRAEAQKLAAQPNKADAAKEGFTTPVYRPGDVVPDPTVPATSGRDGLSAAGTRQYGPDAP